MSRPVAVGVDGSEESLAAVEWAADEAAARGAGLRLVNASQWQEHLLQGVKPSRETTAERTRTLVEAAEERARARHPELSLTTEEREDSPASMLLGEAADAQMLVLGSNGLGGVGGFIIGSVAQEVVADARNPVVVVRPDSGGRPAGGGAMRRVVVGLDVRDVKAELLEFAFDYAARHTAPLHVVHTWHHPAFHHDSGETAERESALAAAVRPFRDRFPAVKVSEEAAPGRAGSHLVEAASNAGLVVVGRRRAARGSHIGSVTHAVLHHAPCPVAVVPHA
ncbi:universal stress protein [Streptomyces sp. NPDC059176]|uniref:universal stress protein n=1 Tax=unclassified Streptomyces TaxID=2593676 RepID=UPI0036B32A7C